MMKMEHPRCHRIVSLHMGCAETTDAVPLSVRVNAFAIYGVTPVGLSPDGIDFGGRSMGG